MFWWSQIAHCAASPASFGHMCARATPTGVLGRKRLWLLPKERYSISLQSSRIKGASRRENRCDHRVGATIVEMHEHGKRAVERLCVMGMQGY